jgi:hypothetical protein
MQKVILDPSLRSQLNKFDREVELCDEAGSTVGYFLRAEWHRELLYAWAKAQFTDEELDLARHQNDGRSLAEILARLGKT